MKEEEGEKEVEEAMEDDEDMMNGEKKYKGRWRQRGMEDREEEEE